MIVTLLIWAFTLFVLGGWGGGLRALLGGRFSPALALLAGLAAATSLAAWISLLAPTGALTIAVLLFGALAGYGLARTWRFSWNWRAYSLPALALAGVTVLFVWASATLKTGNNDTGIYHAQAIRWIESYPAVPGLGNFHTRLAYNTNWFLATAAFSLAFLGGRSYHLTSSIMFLVSALFFVGGLDGAWKGRNPPAGLLKLAYFPLATYLLARDISSPGPDLPATLLVWICFVLYVELATEPSPGDGAKDVLLACLAVFAITVKLSTMPVLLLPLLRLRRFSRRGLLLAAGLGLLILLPWLARNLILSGYPVFPGPAVDLFHFDWRIPVETVRSETLGITSWARNSRLPQSQVMAMSLLDWSATWFENLTVNRRAIFLVALASPLLLVGSVALRGWRNRRVRLWLAAYLGCVYWFFSAPTMRFGYGFLVTAPLLAALPLVERLAARLFRRRRAPLLLLTAALIGYQLLTLGLSLEPRTLAGRLVQPADYTNLPTEPCQTGRLSAWCASQWQECGYAAFPCAPSLNPRVEQRGKSLRQGYRSLELERAP